MKKLLYFLFICMLMISGVLGQTVIENNNWQFNNTVTVSTLNSTNLNAAGSFSGFIGGKGGLSPTKPYDLSGSVTNWGSDTYNILPIPGDASSNVIAVAASYMHVLALRTDGRVVAWGDNSQNQCIVPVDASNSVIQIAAGRYLSLALRSDGRVVAWGPNTSGQRDVPVNASNNIIKIAGGDAHVLALNNKGVIVSWGNNVFGQRNIPESASNNIIDIAGSEGHSLALRSDGRVVAWGDNSQNQCIVPVDASNNVISIAAGQYHSLALRSDGRVVAWGANASGQCNVPVDASNNIIKISSGYSANHTLALRSDGRVVAWGANASGQCNVPNGASNSIIHVAHGGLFSCAVVGKQTTPQLYLTGDITVSRTNIVVGTSNMPIGKIYVKDLHVESNTLYIGTIPFSADSIGTTNNPINSLNVASNGSINFGASNVLAVSNGVLTLNNSNIGYDPSIQARTYTINYISTNVYTYATSGDVFKVVLTNNVILRNPSNAIDGRALTWWIIQDNIGERTIQLDTQFKVPSSATLPLLWDTNANAMTMFAARYDASRTNWYVVSLVPGY